MGEGGLKEASLGDVTADEGVVYPEPFPMNPSEVYSLKGSGC